MKYAFGLTLALCMFAQVAVADPFYDPAKSLVEHQIVSLKAGGEYKRALVLLNAYISQRQKQGFPRDFILASAFRERAALRLLAHEDQTKTDCLWKGIAIDIEVFGRDHPIVARDYLAIADALAASDRQQEAQAYYLQAITILLPAFGPSYPAIQATFEKLARSVGPRKVLEAYGQSRERAPMSGLDLQSVAELQALP
jgi:tetratricopeptide (TPR) repeat protein